MRPMTAMKPVEEILHGVRVQDPYRWLEDRSLAETEEWIRAQNRHCDEYFADCEDLEAIRSRVRQFLDVTTVDQPTRVGNRYFFRRRTQGEEQARIYVLDWTTGEERMLVNAPADPLSSVRIHRISHDGCWMAYEHRFGGSDRREIQFLDVSLGITLNIDVLADWSRGIVFDSHKSGFFYCQDTEPAAEHTIRRHSLLNQQSDSICFRVDRSADSRLLMVADENNIGAIHMYRDGSAQLLDFWVTEQRRPAAWHPVAT